MGQRSGGRDWLGHKKKESKGHSLAGGGRPLAMEMGSASSDGCDSGCEGERQEIGRERERNLRIRRFRTGQESKCTTIIIVFLKLSCAYY